MKKQTIEFGTDSLVNFLHNEFRLIKNFDSCLSYPNFVMQMELQPN